MTRLFFNILLLAFVTLFAQDTAQSDDCRNLFWNNNYPAAVECLNHQLYITPVDDTNRLAGLYESLGVGYMMLEKKKLARASFERLLLLKPGYDLDPNAYLPEIISLFQSVKIAAPVPLKKPALALNLLPLGTPQFVHKQKTKGIALAALQALSLGISIFAYNQKGALYSSRFGYPEKDVATARRYDALYKTTFLTFSAVYCYSIIDGCYHSGSGK